jgi:hypothetical protein
MKTGPLIAAAALLATGLSACTSANTTKTNADATSPSTSAAPAVSTSKSASPLPKLSLSESAVATTIDPCQLVTQAEASSLANASFGPGKQGGSNVRHECVYGAQTPNVLTVYVVEAASPADAQAGWDQLLNQAKQAAGQAAGMVTLTDDSGIGDRAEWAELNLAQINVQGRGLAFEKGSVGVYMIDLVRGGTAPSRDALTAQANTVISRLP